MCCCSPACASLRAGSAAAADAAALLPVAQVCGSWLCTENDVVCVPQIDMALAGGVAPWGVLDGAWL